MSKQNEEITHYTDAIYTKGPHEPLYLSDKQKHVARFLSLKSMTNALMGYSLKNAVCMYIKTTHGFDAFDDLEMQDIHVHLINNDISRAIDPWVDQEGQKCYLIRLDVTYNIFRGDTLLFTLSPGPPRLTMDVVRTIHG